MVTVMAHFCEYSPLRHESAFTLTMHPSRARSAWFRRCVRPVGVGVGMRQFVVPPLETVFVSHDRALVLSVWRTGG